MEREETIKDSQLCTEMDVDTNPQIPLKDSQIAKITKKPRSRSSDFTEESEIIAKDSNFKTQEKKLTKQERIELGKSFQKAINSRDWPKSEELISLSDLQTLNDLLCIAVDLIWFLTLREELQEITGLIRKIVNNGANDFTRATLRTSFLASCVSACQGRNVSLPDAVNIMGQRLHERLDECHGDDMLKTEVTCKVKKFTEWALRCIGSHHSQRNPKDPRKPAPEISTVEVQRQLAAFKLFLDLADCQLSGKDYTEAFDAACFPLTLFNSGEWTGGGLSEGQWTGGGLSEGEWTGGGLNWTGGGCGKVVEGMLEMLVEGGADNVNQCFLEASRFGSTQLVKILLQIAQRNSLDIDVELALGFASHYDKLQTMSFLVDSAGATGFVGPLMRAAERGALPVVKFFVSRGCRHVELCLALAAAAASCRFGVVEFLLPVVPKDVLGEFGRQVINASSSASRCSHGNNSLAGVEFLLKSDFLSDAEATYNVANSIAQSTDDEGFSSELKSFLAENWSEEAYQKGVRTGEEHFVNLTRILERGEEVSVGLGDLPRELVVSVAYLGLYRECVKNGGPLLNQRLRGELVEAVRRLNGGRVDRNWESKELLAILEHHLPSFFI